MSDFASGVPVDVDWLVLKYPFEVDIIQAKHFNEISQYLPSFANVLVL